MKNLIKISTAILTIISTQAHADFVDTLFPKQWAIKNNGQTIYLQDSDLSRKQVVGKAGVDINYVDTSAIATTKSELIVAVLDSGIDLTHPDLQGKIWYNAKLCTGAPNAKNLPCNGYNYLDGNTNLTDDIGHGTHVAGIIAAVKNNIGIVGAADPRIKIMPLKVLNNSVSGFVYNNKLITDVIADAMVFAIKNGAEVINLSLGWPKIIDTPKVRAAFQMAEDNNVMVIAAAGNNNKDLPTFPCSYESVICVAAHDNQGNLTDFTNHGAKVDVVAPGEYIISTYPQSLESRVLRIKNYEAKRGSSQAAPYVTASVATLKLLKPGLTNDNVRAILFNSAKTVNEKTKRFVKYGMLDQNKLYSQTLDNLGFSLIPQLKNVTEVKFNKTQLKYGFQLPIKNLSSVASSATVCVRPNDNSVAVDNECFDIANLASNGISNLSISGSILDLKADSQVEFNVFVNDKKYELAVFFTRDINNDSEIKSELLVGASINDMMGVSNGRKLSRMIRIMDKHNTIKNPEYFYQESQKQTETQSVVSILTKEDSWKVKYITLPKQNRILSIHRQDINLDGKPDYMVYTMANDKLNLKLFFFDQNLNPLFGKNSEWNWPLSTFEGLPIDAGNEKFEWLKISTNDFGTILVPTLLRAYSMPEEDNSKNILERIVSAQPHQYYLKPKLNNGSIAVELRVFDSVAMMKKIRAAINVDSSYRIEWIKDLPSNLTQYKSGTVVGLVRVTNDEDTKYFTIAMSGDAFTLVNLDSAIPLEGSAIYKVFGIDEMKTANDIIYTNLLNRSRANYVIAENGKISYGADLVNQWENPILSLIGAYKVGDQRYFMMENRYSVSFSNQNGEFKYELPVYRDSSFPGQNFSETLVPIVIDAKPAVFVNSTLVFGERLYSMIGDETGLTRPFNLSVNIPDGCAPMAPEMIDGQKSFSYMFLCFDASRQIYLKSLPMLQN